MARSSETAGKSVRELAELVARLASRDIVICRLAWHSESWELQVERGADAERYREGLLGPNPLQAPGPEVVRVFWDGRDHFVSIQASPTRFASAPNEWKDEFAKAFAQSGSELLSFVEDYLAKRLSA
jgi:hypothetical protein